MIAIKLRLDRCAWPVNADPVQVEQVLLNLGANAADAMPEGGRLLFETGNLTPDRAAADLPAGLEPGPYVVLRVADTAAAWTARPWSTPSIPSLPPRRWAGATGLGLASVYGIVKGHGGHVACDSEPGRGTTFRIYWPAPARRNAAGNAPPVRRFRPPQGYGDDSGGGRRARNPGPDHGGPASPWLHGSRRGQRGGGPGSVWPTRPFHRSGYSGPGDARDGRAPLPAPTAGGRSGRPGSGGQRGMRSRPSPRRPWKTARPGLSASRTRLQPCWTRFVKSWRGCPDERRNAGSGRPRASPVASPAAAGPGSSVLGWGRGGSAAGRAVISGPIFCRSIEAGRSNAVVRLQTLPFSSGYRPGACGT